MKIFLKLCILLLLSTKVYSDESCKNLPGIKKTHHFNPYGCTCGKSLEKHKELAKRGLRLIAACFSDDYMKTGTGRFYYAGEAVFDGELYVAEYPEDIGLIFDVPDSKGEPEWRLGLSSSDKRINSPISKIENGMFKENCSLYEFRAKAKIMVKFIEDIRGESGQTGSFLREHKVVSVGNYSCR